MYYLVDRHTGQRDSLETPNNERANALLTAKNEATREPAFNRQKARIYLKASDPEIATHTWEIALTAAIASNPKDSANRHHWETAAKDEALNGLRKRVILETRPTDLLTALESARRAPMFFSAGSSISVSA